MDRCDARNILPRERCARDGGPAGRPVTLLETPRFFARRCADNVCLDRAAIADVAVPEIRDARALHEQPLGAGAPLR